MAEPVGITGTALAVASLLYSSCRTICDFVEMYKKAPKEYRDLAVDLNALQDTLGTLQKSLREVGDSTLYPEQQASLRNLELPLASCNAACENFKNKLSALTSHSTEDHTAKWDRLRLHFNKSDVAFLRQKLQTTKGTIQIALSVCTLKAVTENQTALDTFQEKTATTMSDMVGKVEALTLAVDSLSLSGVTISQKDMASVTQALNEHGNLVKECLQFCTSAMSAAHARISATQVRHAKVVEQATQFIGNVGPISGDAPLVTVDTAEASGNAFQGVGNINADAFRILVGNRG
ncbi:hypothetical protein F5Y19DRAFT_425718, partial [Xylariaceae sp. FL1651]